MKIYLKKLNERGHDVYRITSLEEENEHRITVYQEKGNMVLWKWKVKGDCGYTSYVVIRTREMDM